MQGDPGALSDGFISGNGPIKPLAKCSHFVAGWWPLAPGQHLICTRADLEVSSAGGGGTL